MATITDNDLKMFQERARTELASGCDIGSIAWDSVIWDLCNEVRRLRSRETGDAAKMIPEAPSADFKLKCANIDGTDYLVIQVPGKKGGAR